MPQSRAAAAAAALRLGTAAEFEAAYLRAWRGAANHADERGRPGTAPPNPNQRRRPQPERAAAADKEVPGIFRRWAGLLRDVLALPWERAGDPGAGANAGDGAPAPAPAGQRGGARRRRPRRSLAARGFRTSHDEPLIESFDELWARLPIKRVVAVSLLTSADGEAAHHVTVFVHDRFDAQRAAGASHARRAFHERVAAASPYDPRPSEAAVRRRRLWRAAVLRALRACVAADFVPEPPPQGPYDPYDMMLDGVAPGVAPPTTRIGGEGE